MKPFALLALLALPGIVSASVTIHEELFLPGATPEIVRELIDAGTVEIDHVSSEGFELYGPRGIARYLDSKNLVYLDMKAIRKHTFADYPSSKEIVEKLQALARKYPRIMSLVSIGKSVKGNELLVMKISDNPTVDEVEPEFKYISSMHGDEITGRELSVEFIDELGRGYGTNQEITELINHTEIYIMPSMNPDGSDMRQRGNASFKDLNRNFPEMTRDTESTPAGRETEVQHVMRFQASRQFALSANFHGGTIVANYPWDAKFDAHPLENFVKELSLGWAERNPDMASSSEFPGGITNGAAWYIVKGGMQDWSYFWHNDLQITIELSHQKWPNYAEIPKFYQDNRDSMLYYMKQVHRGAGVKFSRPNITGTVEITQTSPETKNLGSYAFKGSEFYKVMPEGEYTFTVREKNAASQEVSVRIWKDRIYPNGNYARLN